MMRLRSFKAVSVAAGTVLALNAGLAPAAHAQDSAGPETGSFAFAFVYSFGDPDANPPRANDWSCRPGEEHPRPVVLVHGTWENRYNNFAKLSPELAREGYCVFALNYGDDENLTSLPPSVYGTGDIRESAKELAAFVDDVLAATGASTVDIVGHSQGGLMPRRYLKFEGGADKVSTLVALGSPNHGTTVFGLATLAGMLGLFGFTPPLIGQAASQQIAGSRFLAELNAGGDTVPGVDYMSIATRYDEVTTPYESAFLTPGPGADVRNITLQDGCPIDLSDHLSMSYSPRAIGYVKQALDPTAGEPPCLPNAPVI